MRWAEFRGYKWQVRHLVMGVLVILLIISNIADEIAIRLWNFTWAERKIAETVFVVAGGLILCPILYRKYFTHEERENEENGEDESKLHC